MKFPSKGLYAITQTDNKSNQTIIEEVDLAIKGGVSIVQFRDKNNNPADAISLAKELLRICKQSAIPLIINDDALLAHKIGADGVHIGKNDGDIAETRKIVGSKMIIGLSCYDDVALAQQAEANGVDYVAFGRFFPSSSKPLAAPAHIQTLHLAKKSITVPIVAIGGILPENGEQLLTAGANVLAVIGGIFDHDPQQSAHSYLTLFNG